MPTYTKQFLRGLTYVFVVAMYKLYRCVNVLSGLCQVRREQYCTRTVAPVVLYFMNLQIPAATGGGGCVLELFDVLLQASAAVLYSCTIHLLRYPAYAKLLAEC